RGGPQANRIDTSALNDKNCPGLAGRHFTLDPATGEVRTKSTIKISGNGGDDVITGGPLGEQIAGGLGADKIDAGGGQNVLITDVDDIEARANGKSVALIRLPANNQPMTFDVLDVSTGRFILQAADHNP